MKKILLLSIFSVLTGIAFYASILTEGDDVFKYGDLVKFKDGFYKNYICIVTANLGNSRYTCRLDAWNSPDQKLESIFIKNSALVKDVLFYSEEAELVDEYGK